VTPLATKVARELTLPKKDRTFDDGGHVLDLFDREMHCFEVSAIANSVNAVLDEPIDSDDADEAWSVWRDVESMLPRMFLPSPVTWLEQMFAGTRIACVIREKGPYFSLSTVHQSSRGNFSIHVCDFRARGILEPDNRIEVVWGDLDLDVPDDPVISSILSEAKGPITRERVGALRASRDLMEARVSLLGRKVEMGNASLEVMQAGNRFIGMVVLTLDLINTPGLIGLKQREINKGLARSLSRVGRYPLLAWSEVVLKHQARLAEPGERVTGTTYHKCLHFVRSHLRHYRDGHVTVIPAHWRGDPALGIKRTRYRMAA
jgi:hypothetical protein